METLKKGFETVQRFSREALSNAPKALRAMYDLMDNSAYHSEPREREVALEGDEGEKVRQRFEEEFFPPDFAEKLTEAFPEPGLYAHHDVPGHKSEGTKHGHRFIVEVTDSASEVYFLDPEHIVGKRNFWRPQIVNMLAARFPKSTEEPASFAFLRSRTEGVERSVLDSFIELESVAREMIGNRGESEELISAPENIVFRAALNKDSAEVQSRYVGEKGINSMFEGTRLPRFIEGKAFTQRAILGKFLERQFKKRTQKESA